MTISNHQSVPEEVYGLWLYLLSVLCATTMSTVAKAAGNRGVPAFQIVLARSLILLLLTGPALVRQGVNPFSSNRKLLLLLRGLLGLGAVSSLFWAVQYLPIADAAVLQFLAPVFVALLSPLLLRELPSRGVVGALPLCLAGVVLVAQPSFLFGGSSQAASAVGVGLGILQAAFSASAKMSIRALGSTEPVLTIVASMAIVSILGSGLFCAVLPNHFVMPTSATTWALLAATGLLGFGNQVLSTASLKKTSAAPAVAMSYSGVLWGIGADFVVFKDPSGALSLTGAAVVCAGSYLVVWSEQQRGQSGGGSQRARGGAGGGPRAGTRQRGSGSDGGEGAGEEEELLEAGQRLSNSNGMNRDSSLDGGPAMENGAGGLHPNGEGRMRGLLASHARSAPALLAPGVKSITEGMVC